jgi:hypothetical protein
MTFRSTAEAAATVEHIEEARRRARKLDNERTSVEKAPGSALIDALVRGSLAAQGKSVIFVTDLQPSDREQLMDRAAEMMTSMAVRLRVMPKPASRRDAGDD